LGLDNVWSKLGAVKIDPTQYNIVGSRIENAFKPNEETWWYIKPLNGGG